MKTGARDGRVLMVLLVRHGSDDTRLPAARATRIPRAEGCYKVFLGTGQRLKPARDAAVMIGSRVE